MKIGHRHYNNIIKEFKWLWKERFQREWFRPCTKEAKQNMKYIHRLKGRPDLKKVSINSKVGKLKGFVMDNNTCVSLPFDIKSNTEYELLLSEEDADGQREVISWKEVHKTKGRPKR